MKKIVAIASAAVLGLSLAACAESAQEEAMEAEADAIEDTAEAEADAMEATGAITDAEADAMEDAGEATADAMEEAADDLPADTATTEPAM